MKNRFAFALVALTLAAPAWADDTLFAQMGGQAGIDRFADKAVDNYLTDDRIKDTFAESNIDRLRAELKVQFCQIADGPCTYTGHDMTAAPQRPASDECGFQCPGGKICRRRCETAASASRFRTVSWLVLRPFSIRW